MPEGAIRVAVVTALALVCFAANSILCRLALAGGEIDAASFTAIRVVSGAALLAGACAFSGRRVGGDWRASIALVLYAILFSFAYLGMGAGAGALLLFGFVQVGMIGYGIAARERIGALGVVGIASAAFGLVWLVSPGLHAPPLWSAALMAGAGLSWAAYSVLGRSAADPISDTAGNFLRAAPLAALLAPMFADLRATPYAAALAAISGAITSGLGYIAWYAALRSLDSTRAAVLQLSVPAIAAGGGVLVLSEPLDLRFGAASALTLGGVALTLVDRKRQVT